MINLGKLTFGQLIELMHELTNEIESRMLIKENGE